MLVVFSGLPGVGKSTVARLLARRMRACYLRIDTIEQALLRLGAMPAAGTAGYETAYRVAADNLALGLAVVADGVHASPAPRQAWRALARAQGVPCHFVHLACSDPDAHRRRVDGRVADIEGHVLPRWEQVTALRMEPPPPDALVIDTASAGAEAAVEAILRGLH